MARFSEATSKRTKGRARISNEERLLELRRGSDPVPLVQPGYTPTTRIFVGHDERAVFPWDSPIKPPFDRMASW